MFDMLQATCSLCEKGAWNFVWPVFGFFEPDFDETDMLVVTWVEAGARTCSLLSCRDTGLGLHT